MGREEFAVRKGKFLVILWLTQQRYDDTGKEDENKEEKKVEETEQMEEQDEDG